MDFLVKRVSVLLLAMVALGACGRSGPVQPASKAEAPAAEVPPWAQVAPEQIAEARKLGVPVAFENQLAMCFVLIPAGTFLMGSPEEEKGHVDDETQHRVTLTKAYYLQTTEVTNAQYRRFDPKHDSGEYEGRTLSRGNQPVVEVSWDDAQEYVAWLRTQDPRHHYRLPTEAEWERAARAGTKTPFFWGEDHTTYLPGYANGPSEEDGYVVTAPVGSCLPNPWGLRDMLGNAWEWVEDWYGPYPPGPATDPRGPSAGEYRVLRGGSWVNNTWLLRCANRGMGKSQFHFNGSGFRVLVAAAP